MADFLETRVAFEEGSGDDVTIAVYPLDKFNKKFAVTQVVDGKDAVATDPETGATQYKEGTPKIVAVQTFTFQKVGEADSPADWLSVYVPDVSVQRDLINRAVILKQQQKSMRLLQSEDFTPSDTPYDLGVHIGEAAERATADPQTKSLRGLAKAFNLSDEEMEQLKQLLPGFGKIAAASATS